MGRERAAGGWGGGMALALVPLRGSFVAFPAPFDRGDLIFASLLAVAALVTAWNIRRRLRRDDVAER